MRCLLRVLCAVLVVASAGQVQAAASSPRLAALARDVDRAESIRAVKRLETAWALYIDMGAWDRAGALFTDDAELAHAEDRFHGRAEIVGYFRRGIGKGSEGLPAHHVHTPVLMAPIVTLSADGNHAKGRWHAFSMRGTPDGAASWQGGVFECEYVRVGGSWKIARQIFKPTMVGSYESGWRAYYPELPLFPYHFQPEDVGQPAVLGPGVKAAPTTASLPALAGRVQALRDEQAIRNLQDAYGYYVDQKMWVDVADLFAGDGSIQLGGVGSWSGRTGIRQALEIEGPAGLRYGEMNDHIQADVIVEVMPDGIHARARGLDIGMIGRNEGGAQWVLSRFDNRYVKQGGVWRIATMRRAEWFRVDYAQGWGKDWQAPPAPPAEIRPTGPASALPVLWQVERVGTARPIAGMSLAQAEKALFVAAAYDAIENLAGGYGQYLDDNHWEELGQLFAAQGERDSAGGGFIRTPARIASFSRGRYGPYNPRRNAQNMHMRTQPVIDVSADEQKGQIRTRLLQFAIPPQKEGQGFFREPTIVTGMYEDDVVFENGRWRIKRADIDHLLYTHSYKDGWTHIAEGEGAKKTPALAAGVQFDAPGAGDTEPSFPKLPHMWFHYRNPVSGREPPYLMPKYPLPQP